MIKTTLLAYFVCAAFVFAAEEATETSKESSTNSTSATKSAETKDAKKDEDKKEEAKKAATIPDATEKPVLITNTVNIAGQPLTYVAETGMLPILKTDGKPRASVFYISYTEQGITNASERPVMFCFNGGPGSSSVWLHLGALGPRRVKMNDDGTLPKPPFGLVDNEYSVLSVADLVFIDPVATGFSRPAKDEKPEQFFGQVSDIQSVGEFIRLWTTRRQRWLSPKYLCGESYGVFRAAGLAQHLSSRYGMYLNGLVLVSGLIDFSTINEQRGNMLPALIFLPSFTATAQFHHKLPPDLQSDLPKALAEAREFTRLEYPSALLQGAALPAADRARIVSKLVRLTGLPARVIEDNDLHVSSSVFRKELLRDQNLIIGRFDARITGRDADPGERVPGFDPSFAATLGPFSTAMNAYVRSELKFEDDLPYEILSGLPWDYEARNSFPSVGYQLSAVMSQNPYMKLLVLVGMRDLACPMEGLRQSVNSMQLDRAYRENINFVEYQSGHMMYVNLPDLQRMQKDLEGFIRK
jgi:carboxypeptidase C (cathepsin A)